MKRITAAVLTFAVLLSFALIPANAAVFPDITDPDVARDVAVLQMLGIVSGDDNGNFNPDATLTRAQFCKMAVVVMGIEAQEPQYRNRTIFPDVRSSHWAVGYINLAVTGGSNIISGFPDGTFKPDTPITCAQAVTILMRVLGYTDADAGYIWPEGYMEIATSAGLLEGVSAPADGDLQRSQAARMFRNMLDINSKDGKSFLSTLGTAVPDVLILDNTSEMPDGTTGAIRTTAGTFLPKNNTVPDIFIGMRGTLVKDNNDKITAFLPVSGDSRIVTVESAGASYLRASDGTRYTIDGKTAVYTPDGNKTYGEIFIDLRQGLPVTLYFNSGGTVDALYVNTAPATEALVLTAGASVEQLEAYTGTANYTIYKNSSPAQRSDLVKYDVLTYDPVANRLEASDFRFTGAYENASPNLESPASITVLGQTFDVMTSAFDSLSRFKLGDAVTLLFSADLQVAGAVSSRELFANAIGVVDSASAERASVTLLNGIKLAGNPKFTQYEAGRMTGEFVTVFSETTGRINIARLPGPGARQSFDVKNRVIDGETILPYAKVFDRVGSTGHIKEIKYSDITQSVIPASKVTYVGRDSTGKISTIVLDDATGDLYTYGFLSEGWVTQSTSTSDSTLTYQTRTVSVSNGDKSLGPVNVGTNDFKNGLGGLALSITGESVASIITLTEIKNVPRTAFYTDADGHVKVTINGVTYPVSDDVRCYNQTTKLWLDSLTQARAFAQTLTVYVDRAPEDGGKVRLAFVN